MTSSSLEEVLVDRHDVVRLLDLHAHPESDHELGQLSAVDEDDADARVALRVLLRAAAEAAGGDEDALLRLTAQRADERLDLRALHGAVLGVALGLNEDLAETEDTLVNCTIKGIGAPPSIRPACQLSHCSGDLLMSGPLHQRWREK